MAAAIGSMLEWRASTPAFAPLAHQEVLSTIPEVVGIRRLSEDGVVADVYVNVSGTPAEVTSAGNGTVHGFRVTEHGPSTLTLGPWGIAFVLGHTP